MAKSQIQTITNHFLKGGKLTALDCYYLCGSLRMSAHAFRIEEKYNISLVKKDIKGKNRYNNKFVCTQYSMSKTDRIKVRKMIKDCKK